MDRGPARSEQWGQEAQRSGEGASSAGEGRGRSTVDEGALVSKPSREHLSGRLFVFCASQNVKQKAPGSGAECRG